MKTQHRRTILAVDDDEINLMILTKSAQEAGYAVISFEGGEEAWEYLLNHPTGIDMALLDKMMPNLSGIELLKRIKGHRDLRHIPVIIQTGDAGVMQMREGLENGAYYYLTKPFHPEILTAILHSAASECEMREDLLAQMSAGYSQFIGLLQEGEFAVRTHAEANIMAATLAQASIYPEFTAQGLMELLMNAIEHGNLGIGYVKKRQCLLDNSWMEEISRRQGSAEYNKRSVRLLVEKAAGGFDVVITDEGHGFDWRYHMYDENAPGRLNEPNGRGIAKAMIMLDDLRYNDIGNEVRFTIGMSSAMMHPDSSERSPDRLSD